MEHIVDALYEQIIAERKEGKSIAQIAKELHSTQVRVQRVLITEGLWTSNRTRQIAKMRMEGMSIPEIAEALGKDEKTIQTFLPYSRGQYGRNETAESVKSKDYRDRMQTAATNMIKEEAEMQSLLDSRTKSVLHDKNAHLKKDNDRVMELKKEPNWGSKFIYRVKFELCEGFFYGASSDMGLDKEEREELLRYAKAENGIVREVLIPGDMNLHALHYMIQRLFGWQNSHLHHFSISQVAFMQMTEGRFDKWAELCGKLFRFSTDDFEDLYWDDDYKPEISVKNWLKSKYKAPYIQKAYADSLEGNLEGIADFRERFPDIPMDIMLEDLNSKVVFEEDYNTLLEGLTLHELLPAFKELYYLYDYGDDWCVHISMINKCERSTNADHQLPVCTKVDGLNVMDDVGGISGLLNFYRIINGEDLDEKAEMREWARSLGWTGRMSKPENMV